MPVTVIATPGASDANSYCTLLEANTYHEGLPSALALVWTGAASDDLRNRALVSATRLIDESFDWFGCVATSAQRLLWPRSGMFGLNGYSIDSTVIPDKLKEATAELARQLLASDRISDSDLETQDIKRLKAGSIELEFGSPTSKLIPDAVYRILSLWGNQRDPHGTAQVVRS
jgi:hypothetical protein